MAAASRPSQAAERPAQAEARQRELFGRDIAKATTASLAREIGYLGQNPNNYLFEETLEKELEFTLKNLRSTRRMDGENRLGAKRSQPGTIPAQFPSSLSCGERERAALASIIVGKPKILVLDEPTRGMDYGNKTKLAIILELKEQGMTTILVTHDYRFVAEHANRVLLLSDGRLRNMPIENVILLAKDAICEEA